MIAYSFAVAEVTRSSSPRDDVDVSTVCVPHDPSSASVVRREIAADLTAQSITPDSVEDVVLVASELVGNAVMHTHDDADLDIAWDLDGETVVVRVRDASDTAPSFRRPGNDCTSGRGLAIVAALSAEWGVQPMTRGKLVWAKVPVHLAI